MDTILYVFLGLNVIMFIGLIILFVIMTNIKSTLQTKLDSLTSTTKSDLTNATTEWKKKLTFFDHAEFETLDPQLKELLVTNLSYGFFPKFIAAMTSFITRNNLMGTVTANVKALNAMSKEEIEAKLSIFTPSPAPAPSQVVETFSNYFHNFFE